MRLVIMSSCDGWNDTGVLIITNTRDEANHLFVVAIAMVSGHLPGASFQKYIAYQLGCSAEAPVLETESNRNRSIVRYSDVGCCTHVGGGG